MCFLFFIKKNCFFFQPCWSQLYCLTWNIREIAVCTFYNLNINYPICLVFLNIGHLHLVVDCWCSWGYLVTNYVLWQEGPPHHDDPLPPYSEQAPPVDPGYFGMYSSCACGVNVLLTDKLDGRKGCIDRLYSIVPRVLHSQAEISQDLSENILNAACFDKICLDVFRVVP